MLTSDTNVQRIENERSGFDILRAWLKELRLPMLVLLLVFCGLVFVHLLPRDQVLYERLARPFDPDQRVAQERLLAELRANDPPLGSVLPIPQRTVDRTSPVDSRLLASPLLDTIASRPTLVLMIGPCSGCVLDDLRSADELLSKHRNLNVVAVSPSKAAQLERFRKTNRLRLAMVSDPGRQLASSYNADWDPRAYLISASGKLLWCQPDWYLDLQRAVDIASGGGTK